MICEAYRMIRVCQKTKSRVEVLAAILPEFFFCLLSLKIQVKSQETTISKHKLRAGVLSYLGKGEIWSDL